VLLKLLLHHHQLWPLTQPVLDAGTFYRKWAQLALVLSQVCYYQAFVNAFSDYKQSNIHNMAFSHFLVDFLTVFMK
jgi:hypothetical protein